MTETARKMREYDTKRIRSRLIIGARPSPETEAVLVKQLNIPGKDIYNPMVFETVIGDSVRYCCWTGGSINEDAQGNPASNSFTLPGLAAAEALMRLPFNVGKPVVFAELKITLTPLQEIVLAIFERSRPQDAIIVFFGDMAVELDGHMSPAFNFQEMVELENCVAYKRMQA
jgi:hypothetical protein